MKKRAVHIDMEYDGDLYTTTWYLKRFSPEEVIVEGEGWYLPYGAPVTFFSSFTVNFTNPEEVFDYFEEEQYFKLKGALNKFGWDVGIEIDSSEERKYRVLWDNIYTSGDLQELKDAFIEYYGEVPEEVYCKESEKELAQDFINTYDFSIWIDQEIKNLKEIGEATAFTDEDFDWDQFVEFIKKYKKCLPRDYVKVLKEAADILNKELKEKAMEQGIKIEEIWKGNEKVFRRVASLKRNFLKRRASLDISKYQDLISDLKRFDGKVFDYSSAIEALKEVFFKHGISLDDWEDWGDFSELESEIDKDTGEYVAIWAGVYRGNGASADNKAVAFAGVWKNRTPEHYKETWRELYPDPTESWDDWDGIYVYFTGRDEDEVICSVKDEESQALRQLKRGSLTRRAKSRKVMKKADYNCNLDRLAQDFIDTYDFSTWIDNAIEELKGFGETIAFSDESFDWDQLKDYVREQGCKNVDTYALAKIIADKLNKELEEKAQELGMKVETRWRSGIGGDYVVYRKIASISHKGRR